MFIDKFIHFINNCPPEAGGWNDKGDGFIIYKSDLINDIMPCPTYGTFKKQLNNYGFEMENHHPIGNIIIRGKYFTKDTYNTLNRKTYKNKRILTNIKSCIDTNSELTEKFNNIKKKRKIYNLSVSYLNDLEEEINKKQELVNIQINNIEFNNPFDYDLNYSFESKINEIQNMLEKNIENCISIDDILNRKNNSQHISSLYTNDNEEISYVFTDIDSE
jgi:hypothetical protein